MRRVDVARPGRRSAAGLLLLLVLGLLPACSLGAAPATPTAPPDPRLARVSILATQTHFVGGAVTVVGTLQNGDSSGHDITLRADFFDPQGQALGSVQGVAEDVPAGGKAAFEIHGQTDPARYGTTQVSVVSLSERK